MAKSRYTENRLDAALAEGVRRKVPVWLLLDAPWSEDARAWKSEVWNDPHVVELRKQFVTCELNRDTAGETDQAAQFLLQSMAARSGWPLNLFLDPYSGAPIMGTPSLEAKPLVDLLGQMLQAWKIDSDSLRGLAQTQRAALAPSDPLGLAHGKLEGEDVDAWLDDKMMGAWLTPLEQSLDFESGFVGQGEVFHYPSVYKCLLASPELAKWAELALTRLGSSHACDVMGGGFFRSAGRDPDKFVATEKLAVENAELLEAYLSYRNPAHATFLIQVATEITAFLVSDLLQNNSVAAGLSGSAGYYRLSPADLIEAVDGRNRQPAQMFFGIENGGRVPYLPTELTLLATFLKWAPVDLSHALTESKKNLRQFRETHRAALRPVATPATRLAEATVVRALYFAAMSPAAILNTEQVESLCTPVLQAWAQHSTTEGPRTQWSMVRAWLAAARHALHRGDRGAFMRYQAQADEILFAGLSVDAVKITTPFLEERFDAADHLGASAVGLRLHALLDRWELARREGDTKAHGLLARSIPPLFAQAMKLAKPLGLHAASIFDAWMRYKNQMTNASAQTEH